MSAVSLGAWRLVLLGTVSAAGIAGLALAQQVPESILPPGFDAPAPARTPAPAPTPAPSPAAPRPPAPGPNALPAITPPGTAPAPETGPAPRVNAPPLPSLSSGELARLPSLEQLENLSTEELDQLLGLRPRFDIPPGSRRALTRVGVLSLEEGGLPPRALLNQPAVLVRAALAGTTQPVVSRWGHILLRRALVSRLAPPLGMDAVEFAALRAGVLNRLGEHALARALVQDIDTDNWSPELTGEAVSAYVAAGDITGACPAARAHGGLREDGEWQMVQAICNAYAGDGALAATQLERALFRGAAPRIDVLLARRFAGAAGRKGRRAVQIEWQGVDELNPWRFGLAHALGEPVPARLMQAAMKGPSATYYARAGAVLPMLPAADRIAFAAPAAAAGVLSSEALIALYSEAYGDPTFAGPAAARAANLRAAYLAADPAARIAAMRRVWNEGEAANPVDRYAARVLTAYAAARIAPDAALAGEAGELIAAMLTAGLDRDALAWRDLVADGSLGWALLALANPQGQAAGQGAIDSFVSADDSPAQRRSAFLVAGLAGLGRAGTGSASALGFDLARQTRWTRAIARAAAVDNRVLVVLLAGLGMQGESWGEMTPLHLYHITAALTRVGLEAEARMIAAEAVTRA